MKTRLVALFLLTSLVTFAQKSELKTAEKAIKKQDYASAINALKAAEGSIESADAKLKSKFYFLKGQAYMAKKDYGTASKAFKDLEAFEKKSGKVRYSDDAAPMMTQLIQDVAARGSKLYSEKDYANASKDFYMVYELNPKDTTFMFNAAISATIGKDYDNALKYYKSLQDIGYTGISKGYYAINKETNKKENLGEKQSRDFMVKSGKYSNPTDETTESKLGDIAKNMAYIYNQQGKTEEAIGAIQKARSLYPKDLGLILSEADLYIKLNKMDKFGELMKLAVEQDPENPTLFFNLGAVNQDQKNNEEAKKYYEKAIELKPDYGDAYMNLGVLTLEKEAPIVEEMNKNLSDFKKYDELLLKQKAVYKEALPYLEKADQYARNIEIVKTLMNIYESLEMSEKAKKYRELYKELRG